MTKYAYALAAAAALLIGHLFGLHGLYLGWTPYDIFMHLLGGIAIGLFVNALIGTFRPGLLRRKTAIVAGALFFGIVWEVFEVYYNIAGYPFGTKLYYLDTVKDLIDDTIGGLLIALLLRR